MDINTSFLRRVRKSIAGLSVMTLLASFLVVAPGASAATTSAEDAAMAGEFYSDAMDYMIDQDLLDEDDMFDLGAAMPRDEFVYYAMETFFEGEADAADAAGTLPENPFTDVSDSNPYINQILYAYSMGIVTGDTDDDGEMTGTFRPDEGVIRAELPTIIFRILDMDVDAPEDYSFFEDVALEAWYTASANLALGYGIMMGYDNEDGTPTGEFGVSAEMNYAEAFTILYRGTGEGTGEPTLVDMDFDGLTDDEEEEMGTDPEMEDTDGDGVLDGVEVWIDETDPTVANAEGDGTLMVEVVDMDDDTVPTGAMGVTVLGLEVTAMGGDMTLSSLEVERTGVGSADDIEAVYVYHGSERLTNGRTLNSTTNSIEFTGLDIEVAEGDTEMVYIRVDFTEAADAASEHSFEINSGSLTATGGDIEADYPLAGPTYTVSGTAAAEVEISPSGTLSNVTMGAEGAEISQFEISASNEDVSVQEITLSVEGTVSPAALSDLKLMHDGEVVAETEEVNSEDRVTFVLGEEVNIEENDDEEFEVVATIGSEADPDDTVTLYMDETADLLAEGLSTGYGARVTNSFEEADADSVTIEGGELTIADNGPAAQDYAVGADDVVLLEMAFTAERNIELQTLVFDITVDAGDNADDSNDLLNSDGEPNYTNLAVVTDNGYTYTEDLTEITPGASALDVTQEITFDTGIMIEAGETVTLMFTVDVDDNTDLDGDTVSVAFDVDAMEFEDVDSGADQDELEVVPTGTIDGNSHEVQSASLTFSVSGVVPTGTIVARSNHADMLAFVVEAGEANDVTIETLEALVLYNTGTAGTANNWGFAGESVENDVVENVVSTLYLYADDGETMIDSCNVQANGTCEFDSVDELITAADDVLYYIKGDVTSSAPQDDTADFIAINFSDIEATDEEGEDVSVAAITTAAVNGDDSDADDLGNTAPTVYHELTAGGDLTLKAPADQEDDMLVVAGAEDLYVGSATFRAEDEEFEVEQFVLTIINTGSNDTDSLESVTISYEGEGGVTATVTKPVSDATVEFQTFTTAWMIEDGSEDFDIYYNINPHNVDDGGADTLDDLQWRLDNVVGSLEAVGQDSNDTIDGSEALAADVDGPNLYVVNTKPNVAVETDEIDTFLSNGENNVFAFTVTAEGNGSGAVGVGGFSLDVTFDGIEETAATAGAITDSDNWSVYESTDMSTALEDTITITDDGGDDNTGTLADFEVLFADASQIAPGDSKTFVLVLDLATTATTSYITVKMQEDAVVGALNDATTLVAAGNYFVWTDVANTGTDIDADGQEVEVDLNDTDENGYLSGFDVGLPSTQVLVEDDVD